jgi:hypothetical protein
MDLIYTLRDFGIWGILGCIVLFGIIILAFKGGGKGNSGGGNSGGSGDSTPPSNG